MNANDIVVAVTERVRDAANVNVVFGDAVETTGGVTIIPVASVSVSGGGGGSGQKTQAAEGEEGVPDNGRGMGIGVKVVSKPLGYIEIKGDDARFVPIMDLTKVAVGGSIVAGLFLLSVMRLAGFRMWKQRQRMMWRRMHPIH